MRVILVLFGIAIFFWALFVSSVPRCSMATEDDLNTWAYADCPQARGESATAQSWAWGGTVVAGCYLILMGIGLSRSKPRFPSGMAREMHHAEDVTRAALETPLPGESTTERVVGALKRWQNDAPPD